MANRIVHLVRHGQHDQVAGHAHGLGGGLTAIGEEQSRVTAQRLGSLPVATIHWSTLRRASETAAIIAEEFPDAGSHGSDGLWECVPCVPNLPPRYAEQFARYTPEAIAEGGKHAERAFDKYFRPTDGSDKHEIVVCHGNLIRYFACRVLQVQPESWMNMVVQNCGISEVHIDSDGRMVLASFNDVGHLSNHLKT